MSNEHQLKDYFDTLLEPCFLINRDGVITYCNETAAVLCQSTQRRLQKKKLADVVTFADAPDWAQSPVHVIEPSPYKETEFKTLSGEAGKVQITCQKIKDDDQWLVFVRDVTLEERLQKKYRAELEQTQNYSRNLEKMVEERTSEIKKLNRLMTALLDSLEQGFFVFDQNGNCLPFSSKACEKLLEQKPDNRQIWDVLKIKPEKVTGFKKWMQTVFAQMLPFEDLAPLAPDSFAHQENLVIHLNYYPIYDVDQITQIVVVASDMTNLVAAQKEAAEEKEKARFILSLLQKKKQISRFVFETRQQIERLNVLLENPTEVSTQDEIFRYLHTIKGGAATFSIAPLIEVAHHAETQLSEFKSRPELRQSFVSCCLQVIEEFNAFIKEADLLLGRSSFSSETTFEVKLSEIIHLQQSSDISHFVKKYLYERIDHSLKHYNEVIQTLGTELGKSVAPLEIHGGDLLIPIDIYSELFSVLVHAFRNAVDHGIETPETRLARGKPEQGRMQVHCRRDQQQLIIELLDDGNGIDPEIIRKKMQQKGIHYTDTSDTEVIQAIFEPSFSTREVITETSGRGVGMDAIREVCRALGGYCRVESKLGTGTKITISLPWKIHHSDSQAELHAA